MTPEAQALLQELISRCNTTPPIANGKFGFASGTTVKIRGDHPQQEMFAPATSTRVAIAWSATYRAEIVEGRLLVADVARQDEAELATLRHAKTTLDLFDLRALGNGAGPGGAGALGVAIGR